MKKLLALAVLALCLGGCRQMVGGQVGLYINGDGTGCVDCNIWRKCKMQVQCCDEKEPWPCHCSKDCPCVEKHPARVTSGQ